MSIQTQIQALASELASQLPALAQDSPLNAAQVIANRITEAVQPELGQLKAQLDDANRRISEIAYNCPSCGRHDFGLFKDPVSECVKLKARVAELERLCVYARILITDHHSALIMRDEHNACPCCQDGHGKVTLDRLYQITVNMKDQP